MWAISITSLVEEAALGGGNVKRSSGNILDPNALFDEVHLRSLEESISGTLAFLAFHPTADGAVRDYLEAGTLAGDSGPNVMVLFTVATDASAPTSVDEHAFSDWLLIEQGELPAQQLLRELFEPGGIPPLPGLIVFESFVESSEAVYVELAGRQTGDEVREQLRQAFALLDKAVRDSREGGRGVIHRFAEALQRERLPASRSGRISVRQWLLRAYQFAGDHAGDIVAAISTGVMPG